MATAEQLAFSIQVEGKGVHTLLWSDQGDLVRTLLVLHAALQDLTLRPILACADDNELPRLRELFELHGHEQGELAQERLAEGRSGAGFLLVFVQQGSSPYVGPWLNGWRSPLAAVPGSLLCVRHEDFHAFQQYAPDLASFFGSISDASTMLSLFGADTYSRLKTALPPDWLEVLDRMPGQLPPEQEIAQWRKANAPEGCENGV